MGILFPCIVISSLARRLINITGPEWRNSSSTAEGIREGFSLIKFICSGCWSNASRPLLIRLTVVSCPAIMSSQIVERSSLLLNLSSCSFVCTSSLIKSASGFRRFSLTSASMYWINFSSVVVTAAPSLGFTEAFMSTLVHSRNRFRSVAGIPSISEITIMGSG